MRKRAGEFVTLRDLMDEVGADCASSSSSCARTNAHLDFDLDLARRAERREPGLLRAVRARAHRSILAIAARQGAGAPGAAGRLPAQLLTDPEELGLAKLLAALPEMVRGAALAREPHRLPTYLREVAAIFHRFYHHQRVVGDEPELMQARLGLVRATQIVLRRGLELIGVSAPERM